ncbi:S41 family peptidase [Mesobacillus selenatarsenatis]|uniref:TSPc, tail specific protease n=1 Tax=Mesobacillus selenatarsenatis (strain DSM 18680 / JCM 14380 / FERM P-15431 / SF-1) TaxID=1321606 RepID=A0A0A8WZH5_MESS1|nr:S41 family peptidase [Mesobacillus selenatarsenatis]GAM13135.1 TSPc, tail specific protease [Mesobacillus selenatarsenatis SF-1]
MEAIFKEIVHIMHHDYAGWKDKQEWDRPDYFLGKLKDANFADVVKEYLLDFRDKHIYFTDLKTEREVAQDRGFKVRRYEDKLYVTEVGSETRLVKGMAFVKIGGHSILELRERHERLLNENHAERENWTPILALYEYGETDDGQEVQFSFYQKADYQPVYSVRKLNEETLLMTMTDFADPDAIIRMINDHKDLLESVENWIIDVRVNYGGGDANYFNLLPYLMPEEGVDLADQDERMLFNCTEANSQRQLAGVKEQMKGVQDEQAFVFLRAWKREWERNRGKGFVEFDFSEFVPDTFVKGKAAPKTIIVMTDVYCGSAGDSFIENCKRSSKVTVIGRATAGLNDYANLAIQRWDEGYELWYPTSRLSRIDSGRGMTGLGVEPHIYIPWSPWHLDVDVDLAEALRMVDSNLTTY